MAANQTVVLPHSMTGKTMLVCCTVDGVDHFFVEWAKVVPDDGTSDAEATRMVEADPESMRYLEAKTRKLLADERALYMEELH